MTKKEWREEYLSRVEKKHSHGKTALRNDFSEIKTDAAEQAKFLSWAAAVAEPRTAGFDTMALPRTAPSPGEGRAGKIASVAGLIIAGLIAFTATAICFSQKGIIVAGADVFSATAAHDLQTDSPGGTPALLNGAGRAIGSVVEGAINFGKGAGGKIAEFANYLVFGKTEVTKVTESRAVEVAGNEKIDPTVLQKSTDVLETNIIGDTKQRTNDFRAEFGIAAAEGDGATATPGMVVAPSTGTEADDAALKENIKKNFSDEVSVEPLDDNSGIVVPRFRDGPGDKYIYMLVPVDGDP